MSDDQLVTCLHKMTQCYSVIIIVSILVGIEVCYRVTYSAPFSLRLCCTGFASSCNTGQVSPVTIVLIFESNIDRWANIKYVYIIGVNT